MYVSCKRFKQFRKFKIILELILILSPEKNKKEQILQPSHA